MKWFIFFGLLTVSLLGIGCVQNNSQASPSPSASSSPSATPVAYSQGSLVMAVSDSAADMGVVTGVSMTIDKAEAHGNAQGWVTLSNEPHTFDLLELEAKGKNAFLAEASMAEGTYDQVRLHVSSVVVTTTNGTYWAKLPSNELKINLQVLVKANSTSTAVFDFVASESLHQTGSGAYVMAPVIKVEARSDTNAKVLQGTNEVEINGGSIVSKTEVGMDLNGNVGVGLRIPASSVIEISADGVIKITGVANQANAKGRLVMGLKDPSSGMGSVSSVKITLESVKVHSDSKGWVNLSTTQRTFDLLELNSSGVIALLADVNLSTGSYNQVRLDISKVTVTDSEGVHEAKLPSNELKITGDLEIKENMTSTAVFDFSASESLHQTGNGKYILTPVIQLETTDEATVNLTASTLVVTSGKARAIVKAGMGADGVMRVGIILPPGAVLEIDAFGNVSTSTNTGASVIIPAAQGGY